MLTAEINGKPINCYDGSYDKDLLKKWASKNIIKCPVCHNAYEYCHGRLVSPYFRHKDKIDCEVKYSEPETEEHIQGKIALFNWIKSQDGVTDAVMEGWLPATKQRPDVMFWYNNQQYVIEFQCTPIASEQIERHELYQAAGIIDIWIGGKEKYTTGRTYIEKIAYAMFDYKTKCISTRNNLLNKDLLPYDNLRIYSFTNIFLDNITFTGKMLLVNNAMGKYIDQSIKKHNKMLANVKKLTRISDLVKICRTIPEWYKQVWHHCEIKIFSGKLSSPYLIMMNFSSDITAPFTMFIKENSIDICDIEYYNRKVKRSSNYRTIYQWERATRFVKIDELQYSDDLELVTLIKSYFSNKLQQGVKNKYKSRRK